MHSMTLQQFERNSSLMPVLFKNVGWLAGIATLLASSNAFAWSPNHSSVSSQGQLPRNTTLAQDVVVDTEPEQSQSNPDESDSNTSASNSPRFECKMVDGQYTVMYSPESQPGLSYAWATPGTLGGGWTAERRCSEISRRLELYRPDGLDQLQTSMENNYNIICVTTQRDSSCRIVLTVPPGQDPELTRNRVFENLAVADSGQQTDAVATFAGTENTSELLGRVVNQGLSALGVRNKPSRHSSDINLRPFLDPADGGTGTQLRGGIPRKSNTRLNPERFR
jgi:hypothetical protein